MNSAAGDIAAAFVNARRNWKTLPEYPGERPSDLRSAYVIQDAALADWNRPVGGWKVGKINPPMSDELGANRLVGPVFADTVQREGQDSAQFPIFAGGFAAIEAEFMLRLAPQEGPLPATREAAMDWVDEVRIGLEVASSPYAAINVDGPCVTVSDHGNNAGLLLGACVDRTEWDRLDDIAVSLEIDGREVGRASTATMLDGPFGAAAFLLRNLSDRGIAPQPGWWVSSGAITGVHEIAPGQRAIARFAGVGQTEAVMQAG